MCLLFVVLFASSLESKDHSPHSVDLDLPQEDGLLIGRVEAVLNPLVDHVFDDLANHSTQTVLIPVS